MTLEKKKIVPVLFWLISIMGIAFIPYIIIDNILEYIFTNKKAYDVDMIESVVYTLLIIVIIMTKRFKGKKNLLQFKPFKISTVLKILLVDIATATLISWLVFRGFDYFTDRIQKTFVYFLNRFTGKESFTFYTIFRTHFKYTLWLALAEIIIVPVYEELIFRGLIYSKTKKLFNAKIAAIVSSLLFGLIHYTGGYLQVAATMLGGLLNVYCYEKTKTLYASILLHSLHNFMNGIMYAILDPRVYSMIHIICIPIGIIILIVESIRYLIKRKNILCKQE